MAFTRPRAAQIDFDTTNITDTLIRLNSGQTGTPSNDAGIIFERGDHTNVGIIWDESASAFRFISTTNDASTATSDINISAHHSLHTGSLNVADADATFSHGDTGYITKQYVLYGTTTDGTADVEIFVGGTSNNRVPVPTNTTMLYTVDVVARRTDATGESGGWQLKAVADNFSDTVADVGSVYEILVATDDANWSVDCRADDTTDAIKILCTGAAGKTVKWVAVVKTMEVTN
jgi:hypothetical protein